MKQKRLEKSGDQSSKPKRKAKACQFTLLPEEIEQIEKLRMRYQKIALAQSDKPADIVKSEIIRAGIQALARLGDSQFFKTLEKLEVLNEGRPAKDRGA